MKERFDVKGMTCASCERNVYNAVSKINGVSSCEVNLLTNSMEVEFDEKKVNIDLICHILSNEGYEAILKKEKKISNMAKKDYSFLLLIISIVLLMLLMYVSMGHMMWGWVVPNIINMEKNPIGFSLIQLILVLPIVVFYRRYFINGFKRLIKGSPNMDTLIALGAFCSLIYGIFCLIMVILGHNEYHMYLYFESAGMILTMVSLGKYLENLSKKKTTSSLTKLIGLAPLEATLFIEGQERVVNACDVLVDDIVIVKKGEKIPVDGIIIEGQASIDQSSFTGESLPVLKTVGEEVISSSIINSGYIKVQAKKVGEDTSINTIIKLVEEASSSKAPISKLADKISGIFVSIILTISLITFALNLLLSYLVKGQVDFELSFNFAITVIVIACPCALGLATPVAIMVGVGKGAENGLLIKNAEILEKAHSIKTVVLDKTGTITNGRPEVIDFIELKKEENILSILYSLETKSEHPLGESICRYCLNKNARLLEVSEFESMEGQGVKGKFNNDVYYIGNNRTFAIPNDVNTIINRYSKEGKTPLIFAKNDTVIGILSIKDQVKNTSSKAIELLKRNGIRVVMLTGDNKIVANKIAQELGIEEVFSEVYPQDKQRIINSLKKDDKHLVAMVGDGVNDALALTSADLGIAIGAGSDIALECADIVLVNNDLLDVFNVINLSKRVLNTIKLGLFWAFFYNSICIILSTGFLYYINGFKMNPMIASIAMSISSVSVVINALTIKFFKKVHLNYDINEKEIAEEKVMNKIEFYVKDMMCSHCVKHVYNALNVEGNEDIVVDLSTKKVSVTSSLSKKEIFDLVTKEGYNPTEQ
ncbi:MAG: heavy metal translocating P-type ATPase [Bacillales bacterium]|nr:heavy metal translocating P-type ATPase [Bacillales bacterium]MDD6808053.1 heavy metal translocating P-type ATPase [Oscillospiraceae bacterium]